ncbi:hypothetical protein [Salinispira pacifica]|uniref:Lipoprotein n=1 Tax=Salinispira pacifica TaxID=1307761 RepID=V5WKW2_9SPIO|nr:hypothetical protein [Salinispira pacifica]AHC16388.1 hypothetical protein L21SP2_3044 [Salinispira pacifica]
MNKILPLGNRNFRQIIIVVLTVFLLSSCLNVVQTVEGDETATRTRIRMTFSKALVEGAASMTGEQPDYGDLPDFTGEEGLVNTDIPGARVKTSPIDSEYDYGVEIDAEYDSRDLAEADPMNRVFFPVIRDKSMTILLPPNEESQEMDEMTMMFFGSAKYQLFISREAGREAVDEVLVGGEKGVAAIIPMDDVLIVEMPLMLWMTSTEMLPVEITFQ